MQKPTNFVNVTVILIFIGLVLYLIVPLYCKRVKTVDRVNAIMQPEKERLIDSNSNAPDSFGRVKFFLKGDTLEQVESGTKVIQYKRLYTAPGNTKLQPPKVQSTDTVYVVNDSTYIIRIKNTSSEDLKLNIKH